MYAPSRRSLLATGGAVFSASLAGCLESEVASLETTAPEPGSWPLTHYDAGNSSYNEHADPPEGEPDVRWRIETDQAFTGVLVADGTVVGYGDGGLHAVDLEDGDSRWNRDGEIGTAGIADGTVYAAGVADDEDDEESEFAAFELADGETVWTASSDPQRWFGSLLVAEEVVITAGAMAAPGYDTRTAARDRTDGEIVWTLESGIVAGLSDSMLYTRAPGEFSRFDMADTTFPWSETDPEPVWQVDMRESQATHPPAITHRGLFAGRVTSGPLYGRAAAARYELSSGQMWWSTEPRGTRASTPALVGGAGYVAQTDTGSDRGYITEIDVDDGGEQWHVEIDGWVTKTLVAGDVVLAFGQTERDGDGLLFAFDREGSDLWTLEFDSPPGWRGVAAVEETIIVATEGGELLALEAP
ncbi:PQQ-binding-like beta-propeller repeat protein [Natrononativus amylolyticus]|uniref:outer membrane protein assembly factor BamB family protein n=1 Tax=Natrononativus amylolyticus TaxID=2963434 RepID=UPI0020CC831F|nr:PQQ-binding-like beta-propeller repeat protein [Natrononativus amylolyticus]